MNLDVFSNAPQEVKEKAITKHNHYMRFKKAMEQMELWKKEFHISQHLLNASDKDFSDILNRWNPDTNEISNKLETAANEGTESK